MSAPIVTVFRSRLRADAGPEFAAVAADLERRARAAPGFVDCKEFSASDGERVAVIVFASREAHDAWRDDPRHRDAQRRGLADWYASFSGQACEQLTEHRFGDGA